MRVINFYMFLAFCFYRKERGGEEEKRYHKGFKYLFLTSRETSASLFSTTLTPPQKGGESYKAHVAMSFNVSKNNEERERNVYKLL